MEPSRGSRRFGVLVVAVTMVGYGCGSSPDGGDAPLFDSREDIEAALDVALGAADIGVIENPGDPGGGSSPIELLTFQVHGMASEIEAGNGFAGSELDDLVGSPGGLPFSYLIAAWLADIDTPIADAARDLMPGDEDWTQAPNIVFPSAVLMLFVADITAHSEQAQAAGFGPNGALAAHQIGNVCSGLSGWVNSVLKSILDFLTFDETDGIFGFLAEVWNAAVRLVAAVIGGLIELLTAPIVALITDALMIIGTLSVAAKLLAPWDVNVIADAGSLPKAVGDGPDVHGGFTAIVDTAIDFAWPPTLEDCATVAGFTLPDPTQAEGSATEWHLIGLLATVESVTAGIDSDNSGRLTYITHRESSAQGNVVSAEGKAKVYVRSAGFEQLQMMLETLITDQVSVEPIGSLVGTLFKPLSKPVFDKLSKLVQVSGVGHSSVTFHIPEVTTTVTLPPTSTSEPPTTTTTEAPEAGGVDVCLLGNWVSRSFDVPVLDVVWTGGAGVQVEIRDNGSVTWRFDESEPLVWDGPFVDTSYVDKGTAQGTYTATDGSWRPRPDYSGMQSFIETGGSGGSGSTPVDSPLLHSYVMMAPGIYTCESSTVDFITQDTTGTLIHVVLDRDD